jgi:hypothetical protein
MPCLFSANGYEPHDDSSSINRRRENEELPAAGGELVADVLTVKQKLKSAV